MSRSWPQIHNKGRSNCFACALRQNMVCSGITLDDLADFHAGIDDFSYGAGATLFAGGTPPEAVYCIRSGAIKMVRASPAGGERIVRVLKTGDVAGLESAFASEHAHQAVALSEVRACRIPVAHFRRFIGKHAALQLRLFEMSQAALREAETWLGELVGGTIPARTRLARLLLRLRLDEGERIHRFSVEDMAAIVGITSATVSRVVSELVRQGVLVKEGHDSASRHFRGDIAALQSIALAED